MKSFLPTQLPYSKINNAQRNIVNFHLISLSHRLTLIFFRNYCVTHNNCEGWLSEFNWQVPACAFRHIFVCVIHKNSRGNQTEKIKLCNRDVCQFSSLLCPFWNSSTCTQKFALWNVFIVHSSIFIVDIFRGWWTSSRKWNWLKFIIQINDTRWFWSTHFNVFPYRIYIGSLF